MTDINFYQWALKCLIIIGVLLPIDLIFRMLVSKVLLERPVDWMKEGKTVLKEIYKANIVVGIVFTIEGVISNLAIILGIVFLVLGVIFN